MTHVHSLDQIAGYVVRQTMDTRGGVIVRSPREPALPGGCQVGIDRQEYEGATSYGRALDLARSIRGREKAWAVVDPYYADGCRGMG